MKNFTKLCVAILATTFAFSASADPMIEVLDGGDGIDVLGGYQMTPYGTVTETGCTTSAASPMGGHVTFDTHDYWAAYLPNDFCMSVYDPYNDPAKAEDRWWQYDHGDVYTTWVPWVELILPAGTNAFSFYVGASFSGSGWIGAFDSNNAYTHLSFNDAGVSLSPSSTPGFGVYATGSCTTITRIIIEPSHWGTGYFAGNQDSCTTVPEPGTLVLLGLGLLGLALTRRLQPRLQHTA